MKLKLASIRNMQLSTLLTCCFFIQQLKWKNQGYDEVNAHKSPSKSYLPHWGLIYGVLFS